MPRRPGCYFSSFAIKSCKTSEAGRAVGEPDLSFHIDLDLAHHDIGIAPRNGFRNDRFNSHDPVDYENCRCGRH
jgi:hypothetical protein